MRIEFNKRSTEFRDACVAAIRAGSESLDSGRQIQVSLEALSQHAEFSGEIRVKIRKSEEDAFDSDYPSEDPTWFPARIKGAATALRDCQRFGEFLIEHRDGLLTIRSA